MKNLVGATGLLIISLLGFSYINRSHSITIPAKWSNAATQYVCLPCGCSCDNNVSDQTGICINCNMKLADKATVKFNSIEPADICSFITRLGKQHVMLPAVRKAEEFKSEVPENFGRLQGSNNIPVLDLETRIGELKKY